MHQLTAEHKAQPLESVLKRETEDFVGHDDPLHWHHDHGARGWMLKGEKNQEPCKSGGGKQET